MSPVATSVAAVPATINLTVYRVDTWTQGFRFLTDTTPVDLTGLTIQAQARDSLDNTSSLVVTITDPTDGTLKLSLPTGGLPADLYSYDIEVDDAGAITSWVRGKLRIERDVTNELT